MPPRSRDWCTRSQVGIRFSPFSSFLRSPKRGYSISIMTRRAGAGRSIRIHAKGYTDNVADLMVGKLARLPVETQAALQQLACLGSVAEMTMLSIVLGKSNKDVRSDLWQALRLELVERLEGSYKFVHDRVQGGRLFPHTGTVARGGAPSHRTAALGAYPGGKARRSHLRNRQSAQPRGAALITTRAERGEQLAELNLLAGQRARATTAYASALAYPDCRRGSVAGRLRGSAGTRLTFGLALRRGGNASS